MNIQAIEQAGLRLERAQRALNDLRAATDYERAEQAWSDFLLAANTFFSKLQQGAKEDGKSNAWFGRKVDQRRTDPTLRYIRAARHSDEHGIERIIQRHDAGWGLPFGEQKKTQIQKVDPQTSELVGEPIDAYLYGPRIVAITAHDRRYNDKCDPPVGYIRGEGSFPPDIAEDAVAKLRHVLEEAAELV